MTKTQAITELLNQFHTVTKNDGSTIVAFTLESIESQNELHQKLSEIIDNAECGRDSAYSWIVETLERLQDYDMETVTDDQGREFVIEIADNAVPIYNQELLDWLASDNNYGLYDTAQEDGLLDASQGIISNIRATYYFNFEPIAIQVWELVQELAAK